jgi:hypothetical protein
MLIIDPVEMGWNSFSINKIRNHHHNIDIEFTRKKGMIVRADVIVRAGLTALQKR